MLIIVSDKNQLLKARNAETLYKFLKYMFGNVVAMETLSLKIGNCYLCIADGLIF